MPLNTLIIATDDANRSRQPDTQCGICFHWDLLHLNVSGDYASGTNHTLPTNGAAAAFSGISVDSFVKKITFQDITTEGIPTVGPAVEVMAEAEALMAHKNAGIAADCKDLSGQDGP